jgi:hypothetical protein
VKPASVQILRAVTVRAATKGSGFKKEAVRKIDFLHVILCVLSRHDRMECLLFRGAGDQARRPLVPLRAIHNERRPLVPLRAIHNERRPLVPLRAIHAARQWTFRDPYVIENSR